MCNWEFINRINNVIDFELFRSDLEDALLNNKKKHKDIGARWTKKNNETF